MAQPTPYVPSTSFTDYQTENPADPLPGDGVDVELALIKQTLDQILSNLALIQRDDTELANQTVGADQLKPELTLGLNQVTTWLTLTAYKIGNGVWYQSKLYRCLVAHTSNFFSTDLAADKWELIMDLDAAVNDALDGITEEVQDDADAAAASAAAAAASQSAAAASAAAAAASAAGVGDGFSDVSVTSQAIALGAKTFAVTAGKSFKAASRIIIASRANNANRMYAEVTSYSGTTLIVDVQAKRGSGTYTDWDISFDAHEYIEEPIARISLSNATGNVTDQTVILYVPVPVTFTRWQRVAEGGTADVTINIEGTAIDEADAAEISSTPVDEEFTANNFADIGDEITVTVESNSLSGKGEIWLYGIWNKE
jgi:hypothetical protein